MVSEASEMGDYVAHVNVNDLDTGANGEVQLEVRSNFLTCFVTTLL